MPWRTEQQQDSSQAGARICTPNPPRLTFSTFMLMDTMCCRAGMPAPRSSATNSVDLGLQNPTPARMTAEAGSMSASAHSPGQHVQLQ